MFGDTLEAAEFEDLGVCVYGLSYHQREITERLYDFAIAQHRQPVEILLAHGGDEKHIPFSRNRLVDLGYDYIAFGHIHKPLEIVKDKIYYAGALEPTDKNDTGVHGYIKGKIEQGVVETEFVPFAKREYIHMEVNTQENMTGRAVKEKLVALIQRNGTQNIYKVVLTGFRDPDILYDLSQMDVYGNIIDICDETEPAYDYDKLAERNEDNLLGKYIENLKNSAKGSVEHQALFEGVRALLETKRG